jgi:hypothetical protein
LNPAFAVGAGGACTFIEVRPIGPQQSEELVQQVSTEGYFHIESILPASELARMKQCVEILRKRGWPLVFAFIYDEFWLITRSPSLVQFLSAVLGRDYKQIPHIWAHYVRPTGNAAGWPPHVDGPGRSNRLTVWVPLGDATLENGCMYLIPWNAASRQLSDRFTRLDAIEHKDLRTLLQSTRAMPARAGAVLGWAFDVIHWGSPCTREAEPRISISLEFISGTEQPAADELPLLDPHKRLPSFPQRLYAIGKALGAYERFEPLTIRFIEFAKRLIEKVEPLLEGYSVQTAHFADHESVARRS